MNILHVAGPPVTEVRDRAGGEVGGGGGRDRPRLPQPRALLQCQGPQHKQAGCIKFLIPPGGEFIKSVGEEYQVVMRGREYQGCGEEYKSDKKAKGKQYHLPYYIKAVFARKSCG